MDWGNLSGILTGVLTVFAIITGALLGLQRGTMSNLRDRADDLSKTAADLRARIGDLDREVAELRVDNGEMHAENELLKRLNSQTVNWTAVTDLIASHDKAAEGHWVDLDKNLHLLHTVLQTMAAEIALQRKAINDEHAVPDDA